MTFIVPPGRNKILDTAWKAHKAAQRAEGRKKPEPVEAAPAKKSAATAKKRKTAKPPRAKGGTQRKKP